MGMFDDLKCDALLPDDRVPPGSWFQTKSLDCCMFRFTITAEGKLIYHRHKYENAPDHEIRPGVFMPQFKLVHVEDVDTEYHGDIRICGSTQDDDLAYYIARFTRGTLEWIRPYDKLSETHATWLHGRD